MRSTRAVPYRLVDPREGMDDVEISLFGLRAVGSPASCHRSVVCNMLRVPQTTSVLTGTKTGLLVLLDCL